MLYAQTISISYNTAYALSTPHSTFSFVIVELILLPYLLVIPLSFVNTFDINDNCILNKEKLNLD